jgi:hypothetical protein
MDDATRKYLDDIVWRVLRDAGIRQPPVHVEVLLEHLRLHRAFYDLEDPGFLDKAWHRFTIGKHRLIDFVRNKMGLKAALFFDARKVVIDDTLPAPKQEFAGFHEVSHDVIPHHKTYFQGDTAQTLDPDFQEMLEAEANYTASALMFCGPVFTTAARDTAPGWAAINALRPQFGNKSIVTTVRRYVGHGPDHPMLMLVSTPPWKECPSDQINPWRHFVPSGAFKRQFSRVTPRDVLTRLDVQAQHRRGGPVANFTLTLDDDNNIAHEFHAESFFNTHDLVTLFTHLRQLTTTWIVAPAPIRLATYRDRRS